MFQNLTFELIDWIPFMMLIKQDKGLKKWINKDIY